MQSEKSWLLDTGILLHWIRASKVAKAIEAQFHLHESTFRPLICEVSLGEIEAFARDRNWGPEKRDNLKSLKKKLVAIDLSDSRVIEAYADISTLAKQNGWGIFHGKNDLWVAAAARISGATLLTIDKDFQPLRDGNHLDVVLLDAKTGWRIP